MRFSRPVPLSAWALVFAVFLSGAVLLGVEIAASRVLAPYFGSSIYVWGALIGVVLTGLAFGYWLGGAAADRWPRPSLLVAVIAGGAALVFAIPFLDGPVMSQVAAWDLGARANPLLSATILFGPMSVVLAMVTPIAVRLRALSIASVGRTSGRLFSLSTAGSIAGVFATAFFLIPEVGLERLLLVGAATLFLAALVVAAAERLWAPSLLVGVALAGALAATSVAGQEPSLGEAAPSYTPAYRVQDELTGERPDLASEGLEAVHTEDSQYHRITVADSEDSRFLRFDSSFQSGMYLDRPDDHRFEYTAYMTELAFAYNPEAEKALLVGLGGGSIPKSVYRDLPQVALTAVELDPAVKDVAYRFFELPAEDERLKVVVDDGRRFLRETEERWDVVMLDAYHADSVPFHLTTQEFMRLVEKRLRPGGVLVTNVIGALEGPRSKLLRSFLKTQRSVFKNVALHPVRRPGDDDTQLRNVVFVATDAALPSEESLLEGWQGLTSRSPDAPRLEPEVAARDERDFTLSDVPILTDDYAPTDALLLFDE